MESKGSPVAQSQPTLVGEPSPEFSALATDGKTYSLANMDGKSPMVLAFWKNPCPHNGTASTLVNSIVSAYKDKVNVVGVVNSPAEKAKAFQEKFGMAYPFMEDADKKIIRDFKHKRSIAFVVIGADKRVEAVIGGYGQEAMVQLNAAMAKAAGVDVASLDFTSAPTGTVYG